jgi:hypothetical protein
MKLKTNQLQNVVKMVISEVLKKKRLTESAKARTRNRRRLFENEEGSSQARRLPSDYEGSYEKVKKGLPYLFWGKTPEELIPGINERYPEINLWLLNMQDVLDDMSRTRIRDLYFVKNGRNIQNLFNAFRELILDVKDQIDEDNRSSASYDDDDEDNEPESSYDDDDDYYGGYSRRPDPDRERFDPTR